MQPVKALPKPDYPLYALAAFKKTAAAKETELPQERPRVSASDIEKYVDNLWRRNEDPYIYSTD